MLLSFYTLLKALLEFNRNINTAEYYVAMNCPKSVEDVDRLTKEFLSFRNSFVFHE